MQAPTAAPAAPARQAMAEQVSALLQDESLSPAEVAAEIDRRFGEPAGGPHRSGLNRAQRRALERGRKR